MPAGPAPARPRRLVVEADGGSRGNPGVAGYGALVRDAGTGDGPRRASGAARARRRTTSRSTAGLIAGLEAAAVLAPGADVEVRMDSRLVVEQMAGRWKTKHPDMRDLAAQARDVVTRLGTVTWTWVPRSDNTAADRLSNIGMDGRAVDTLATALARSATDAATDPVTITPDPAEATAVGENPEPPSAPTGATRLLLVRHAVTPYTEAGRVDGRGGADPDLSDDRSAAGRAGGRSGPGAHRGRRPPGDVVPRPGAADRRCRRGAPRRGAGRRRRLGRAVVRRLGRRRLHRAGRAPG